MGASAQESKSSDSLAVQSIEKIEQAPNQKPDLKNYDFGKYGKLKLSGYLQAQWQLAEEAGAPAFADGGSFPKECDNRFMVRRGRIKLTYEIGFATFVFQPDFTEKGLKMRDVYLKVATYNKHFAAQIGAYDRPFGYEISYSSSKRESPERSRIFNSLMPGEREVGLMGSANYYGFKLDAGVFNGNGLTTDNDSFKDFIGRLAYETKLGDGVIGAEASYYRGTVYNLSNNYFRYTDGVGFESTNALSNKGYKREYFGMGLHFTQNWWAGKTNFYGEFLWGTQPGTFELNRNQVGDNEIIENGNPLYLRQFNGGYALLAHTIGKSKHTVVLKYDVYDPNTQVAGNAIGNLPNTGRADIAYTTYGVGYVFNWTDYLRLTAYYDIVCNETSTGYNGFQTKRPENILTLRAQIKF